MLDASRVSVRRTFRAVLIESNVIHQKDAYMDPNFRETVKNHEDLLIAKPTPV
jgi:hypothetical protein